jgi:hypothetical protein
MSSYVFAKFPVEPTRLEQEIRSSAIVTALNYIETVGDQLSIHFKATLSNSDEAILNEIVSAHNGAPLPVEAQPVIVVSDPVQKDPDGAAFFRIKAAPAGWTFQLRGFEFKTSNFDSIVNLDAITNVNLKDVTMRLYDSNGNEILDNSNATEAVKTVVDYEPAWDYYIKGGFAKILSSPSSDVRLSVVAAPDIPGKLGGSKIMIQNINFAYMPEIRADGQVAKYMIYNPAHHTNKLRFIIRHGAGEEHGFIILLEQFKV